MSKLLVSAFEPFAGEKINASAMLLERLEPARLPRHQLHRILLPVDRFAAPQLLQQAVDEQRPDWLVMLGEAGGRAVITPERVAINLEDYAIVDNAGHQPVDEPVQPGGPAAYFSGLPLRAMMDQFRATGTPAELSSSAGLFVCNRLFYSLLHHIDQTGSTTRAGFIHLPWLPEQTGNKPANTPSMPLQQQLEGLLSALAVLD